MTRKSLWLSLNFFILCGIGMSQPAFAQDNTEAEVVTPDVQTLLEITSSMTAEVFVDNQPAGFTPIQLPIDAGKHTVRVSADGYDPYVRRVSVLNGQTTTLAATLVPGGGTVEFQASISPAKLILDDGEMILPIRLNELSEGTHKWSIQSTGYESVNGTFTFDAGKNIFIYRNLESSIGKVQIESNPIEASVFLDGENIGVTPLSLEDIDSGVHNVVIRKRRYATAFRTMDTSLGNKGVVKASLGKLGSKVTIRTKNKHAEVYVEDNLVGTGRSVRLGLVEKGNYDVRIVCEGYKTLESDIHVPVSGKSKFITGLIESDESGTPSLAKRGSDRSVNWTLWSSVALGSVAVTTGSILMAQSLEPEAAPKGDVVITLP